MIKTNVTIAALRTSHISIDREREITGHSFPREINNKRERFRKRKEKSIFRSPLSGELISSLYYNELAHIEELRVGVCIYMYRSAHQSLFAATAITKRLYICNTRLHVRLNVKNGKVYAERCSVYYITRERAYVYREKFRLFAKSRSDARGRLEAATQFYIYVRKLSFSPIYVTSLLETCPDVCI